MLTQTRLKEICYYNPETGVFTAIKRRANSMPGAILGTRDNDPKNNGRMSVSIDGKDYRLHRLAWLYAYGEWPSGEIDHANGDASDNRLCNLRLATRSQNTGNTRIFKTNKSGRKGVSWHKGGQKWQAHIKVNNVNMYLGLFDSIEKAHAAYCEAAITHRGEFARFG